MTRTLLEIAANSLGSALAAQTGGADRVELCENLGAAGCTPSLGTLTVTRDRLTIPLYALIRPRTGDFVYDESEVEVMLRDIEACVRIGCDGIVIGALDGDGNIDEPICRALIRAAGSLGVTFHRAFDVTRDPIAALQVIRALGCERVLTSGGEPTARLGASRIAAYVQRSSPQLAVMAGAGVDASNVRKIVEQSGVHEVHASARALRVSSTGPRNDRLPELSPDRWETDVERVRGLVKTLDMLAGPS